MNRTQREATLRYLEFHLISMVEGVADDVPGIVQSRLYDHANSVLKDVGDVLKTIEATSATKIK